MATDLVDDMATDTAVDLLAAVRRAVGAVEDPEMPPVTIGQLGMVHDVVVEGARAGVEVIPTFSGCPAIAYIGADIESAALGVDGIEAVDVVWRRDIGWGPERITESGRATLTEAGIAPPGSGQALVQLGRRPSADPVVDGVTCPHCGSRNTRDDSPFGSAPCRSTHSCRSCRTPFDAIKDF
ncbi:1,2-phenylacetyl-CoA epoxidase subunit PaaD [Euzebya rosea]|uniref:1,2-phenylacetyl-CoA epoxidase subunit PaaD n=1 Tax=Euzebya rosea TaxID=2052804 RepID=UPI00130058E7|nr:1,2-phenylacetyl-CoA epoxidase subunit PaaD [Euzebya rosea]